VANQESDSEVRPLREIDAPNGIDLNPNPPEAVRVSKRAGLVALAVLCGLASLFGFSVYQRTNRTTAASFAKEDSKKVIPATKAAEEITRDIPSGVINLATEANDGRTPSKPSESSRKATEENPKTGGGTAAPRRRLQSPPNQNADPTPEERLIAEAYRRQLQAVASPTSIRSGSSTAPPPRPSAPPPSASDASALAALAQALRPNTPAAPAVSSSGPSDQNMQTQKEAFLVQARAKTGGNYLPSTRTNPLSEYDIKAGWEIPAMLEQEINSELPGEIKALVTTNVYDTATGQHLLIPQGSRLIGSYDSHIAYGQDSLQVVWHRIIFPDASSVDLGGMIGQDATGAAGFRGDVDRHYSRLIGFSVLSSLFSAGFQLSQTRRGTILQNPSPAEIAAGAVGQEISQTGAEITRRNLNVQPTLKIPVGYKFNVRVNHDILFDGPYDPNAFYK
jgi:type IV secretion system protein VirB10